MKVSHKAKIYVSIKIPCFSNSVGVSRLYDQTDLRLSYVIWQEGVAPFVVVELLSPGTEKEDLGETVAENLSNKGEQLEGNGNMGEIADKPPGKWEVYEQILRIPYYYTAIKVRSLL